MAAEPPAGDTPGRLAGRGDVGRGTTGRVSWRITPHETGGALVTLAAVVDQASLLDRGLLATGRWWPQYTFNQALINLDALLISSTTPAGPTGSPRRRGGPLRGWTPRDLTKHRVSTALARYVVNPLVRKALDLGVALPGYALLETTGQKSGLPRRTPVGNGLDGDTFWIVAEHGRKAAYVRNIEADPHVRVKVGRTWRIGTAHLMPDDDPRDRQRKIGRRFNAVMVRLMGTELLTVRIDLHEHPAATVTAAASAPN